MFLMIPQQMAVPQFANSTGNSYANEQWGTAQAVEQFQPEHHALMPSQMLMGIPHPHPPQQQMSMAPQTNSVGPDYNAQQQQFEQRRGRQRPSAGSLEDIGHLTQDATASGAAVQNQLDVVKSEEMGQALLQSLRTGTDEEEVVQRFQYWAFASKVASHAAQHALCIASPQEAVLLSSGLRGHVWRAVQSKHANYVVQAIVTALPIAKVNFVVEELIGFGDETARHRFGCRLLCRILEHFSQDDETTWEQTCTLIDDVLSKVEDLCSDAFGSYVVRHVLEFGLPQHKHRVAQGIIPWAAFNARHKLGSHVVEAALEACSPEDQCAIAQALMQQTQLGWLGTHAFARHVVRAMLSTPMKEEVKAALIEDAAHLRQTRLGRTLLQRVYSASA